MTEASTAAGGAGPAPGKSKEEPDLWQEDDIPTDDGGDGGEARDEVRPRETTPERQTDSPRE
jgi:hypothetical protein